MTFTEKKLEERLQEYIREEYSGKDKDGNLLIKSRYVIMPLNEFKSILEERFEVISNSRVMKEYAKFIKDKEQDEIYDNIFDFMELFTKGQIASFLDGVYVLTAKHSPKDEEERV